MPTHLRSPRLCGSTNWAMHYLSLCFLQLLEVPSPWADLTGVCSLTVKALCLLQLLEVPSPWADSTGVCPLPVQVLGFSWSALFSFSLFELWHFISQPPTLWNTIGMGIVLLWIIVSQVYSPVHNQQHVNNMKGDIVMCLQLVQNMQVISCWFLH